MKSSDDTNANKATRGFLSIEEFSQDKTISKECQKLAEEFFNKELKNKYNSLLKEYNSVKGYEQYAEPGATFYANKWANENKEQIIKSNYKETMKELYDKYLENYANEIADLIIKETSRLIEENKINSAANYTINTTNKYPGIEKRILNIVLKKLQHNDTIKKRFEETIESFKKTSTLYRDKMVAEKREFKIIKESTGTRLGNEVEEISTKNKYMMKELKKTDSIELHDEETSRNREEGVRELIGSIIFSYLLYDRAPKIGITISHSNKEALYIRSKYLENITTLSKFSGNKDKNSTSVLANGDKLEKIEGFEKVIAACNVLGDEDYHGGNLLVQFLEEGDKIVATIVKIDHGKSFFAFPKDFNSFVKMIDLDFSQCGYADLIKYGDINFNVHKYSESLSHMLSILTDEEIDKFIDRNVHELKRNGFDFKGLDIGYLSEIDLKNPTQESIEISPEEKDGIASTFKSHFKNHIKQMRSYSDKIKIISEYSKNKGEDFENSGWIIKLLDAEKSIEEYSKEMDHYIKILEKEYKDSTDEIKKSQIESLKKEHQEFKNGAWVTPLLLETKGSKDYMEQLQKKLDEMVFLIQKIQPNESTETTKSDTELQEQKQASDSLTQGPSEERLSAEEIEQLMNEVFIEEAIPENKLTQEQEQITHESITKKHMDKKTTPGLEIINNEIVYSDEKGNKESFQSKISQIFTKPDLNEKEKDLKELVILLKTLNEKQGIEKITRKVLTNKTEEDEAQQNFEKIQKTIKETLINIGKHISSMDENTSEIIKNISGIEYPITNSPVTTTTYPSQPEETQSLKKLLEDKIEKRKVFNTKEFEENLEKERRKKIKEMEESKKPNVFKEIMKKIVPKDEISEESNEFNTSAEITQKKPPKVPISTSSPTKFRVEDTFPLVYQYQERNGKYEKVGKEIDPRDYDRYELMNNFQERLIKEKKIERPERPKKVTSVQEKPPVDTEKSIEKIVTLTEEEREKLKNITEQKFLQEFLKAAVKKRRRVSSKATPLKPRTTGSQFQTLLNQETTKKIIPPEKAMPKQESIIHGLNIEKVESTQQIPKSEDNMKSTPPEQNVTASKQAYPSIQDALSLLNPENEKWKKEIQELWREAEELISNINFNKTLADQKIDELYEKILETVRGINSERAKNFFELQKKLAKEEISKKTHGNEKKEALESLVKNQIPQINNLISVESLQIQLPYYFHSIENTEIEKSIIEDIIKDLSNAKNYTTGVIGLYDSLSKSQDPKKTDKCKLLKEAFQYLHVDIELTIEGSPPDKDGNIDLSNLKIIKYTGPKINIKTTGFIPLENGSIEPSPKPISKGLVIESETDLENLRLVNKKLMKESYTAEQGKRDTIKQAPGLTKLEPEKGKLTDIKTSSKVNEEKIQIYQKNVLDYLIAEENKNALRPKKLSENFLIGALIGQVSNTPKTHNSRLGVIGLYYDLSKSEDREDKIKTKLLKEAFKNAGVDINLTIEESQDKNGKIDLSSLTIVESTPSPLEEPTIPLTPVKLEKETAHAKLMPISKEAQVLKVDIKSKLQQAVKVKQAVQLRKTTAQATQIYQNGSKVSTGSINAPVQKATKIEKPTKNISSEELAKEQEKVVAKEPPKSLASLEIDTNPPPTARPDEASLEIDSAGIPGEDYPGHITRKQYSEIKKLEAQKSFKGHEEDIDFYPNKKEDDKGKIKILITEKTTEAHAIEIAKAIEKTGVLSDPTYTITGKTPEAALKLLNECKENKISISRIVLKGKTYLGKEGIQEFLAEHPEVSEDLQKKATSIYGKFPTASTEQSVGHQIIHQQHQLVNNNPPLKTPKNKQPKEQNLSDQNKRKPGIAPSTH